MITTDILIPSKSTDVEANENPHSFKCQFNLSSDTSQSTSSSREKDFHSGYDSKSALRSSPDSRTSRSHTTDCFHENISTRANEYIDSFFRIVPGRATTSVVMPLLIQPTASAQAIVSAIPPALRFQG